jgi:hypothetical protein
LKPDGVEVVYAAGNPAIVATGTGVYDVSDLADTMGTHYLEVTGTAPAAGVNRFSFVVDPRWPNDLLLPHALTTIEDMQLVLDRVGSQGGDGYEEDDNRWIAELINVFSRLVQDYCEREFLPKTNDLLPDVARKFLYDGDGILSLAPYDARDIATVTMYTDIPADIRPVFSDLTEGYVATGNSWYANPRNLTAEGTIVELELPTRRRGSRPTEIEVTVVAKWGAGVVPLPVKHVVEAEVANTYWASRVRDPNAGQQENYLPQVQTVGGPYALDPRSEEILKGYSNHELV